MNTELFILNGYGQYVWPAFIFTFIICFSLYIKTRKEYRKQEKMFLKEFEQAKTIKTEIAQIKETRKKALSLFKMYFFAKGAFDGNALNLLSISVIITLILSEKNGGA